MISSDRQPSSREACLSSRLAGWPEEMAPEYPQASYYRARYYDPSAGRFLSEDAFRFYGDMNFYTYVRNDPMNVIDLFGLHPGDKYPSVKCAGYNAASEFNPPSIAQNREYTGYIYQNPDGTFSYTDPHAIGRNGKKDGGIGDARNAPIGNVVIPAGPIQGWFHTHSGGPLNAANKDFSPDDMSISDTYLHGVPGFLGTPKPEIRMYIPNPNNPQHGIPFSLNEKNCGCTQ